jgi:signal peptide peptidase SppA
VKTSYLPHLAGRVFGVPLLIQPQKLSVILQAIGPRVGIPDPVALEEVIVPVAMPMDDGLDGAGPDKERDRKPYMVTPDGIAVIGISGTLVKKASWLDTESGLQSYESIRSQFGDAVADPRIRGILLDVDSPGGEVGGLFDLADEIFAARQEKPVYAVANDEAFSAAYALASSAEKLFVTRTGGVGSVGVIAVHLDQSGFDEKVGRKFTAVYAGARKNDFSTHQPLTDDARATLQTEIDWLYEIFVGAVGRNRDLKAALVRNTEAGLFYGEKALSAGLADRVGTFDQAVAAVVEAAKARRQSRVAASAGTQIPQGEMTMDQEVTKTADATAAPAPPVPTETKSAEAPTPAAAPAAPTVDAAAIEANLRAQYEEIAALCSLAGKPEFLPEAISKKMTVPQVRDALLAAKAADSHRTAVQTQTHALPVGAEAQLKGTAEQIAAAKRIPFAQAYVEALNQNPKLYEQYLAEQSATVKPS